MKFRLHIDHPEQLTAYLQRKGLFTKGESITKLEKAGEGNMNITLRATFNDTSIVIKQANPFVEKYPSIPAPEERAEVEFGFFQLTGEINGLRPFLPKPILSDPENHIQVLEDLGRSGDFTSYYKKGSTPGLGKIKSLVGFLKTLHESTDRIESVLNLDMRRLNHTHVFDLPFRADNGFDLDDIQPGLQNLAERKVFNVSGLREKAASLGEAYLSARGPALLHGDFFPGSWLETPNGVKVIDPEFCFSGPVEFDLGVLKAHLIFCGMSLFEINTALEAYGPFGEDLADDFCGVELLRRLYGVAQLPLPYSISEKELLTKQAFGLLKL